MQRTRRTKSLLPCLGFLTTPGGVAGATPKPNLLLFCVDDLKRTLGCYRDRLAVFPNIDRLAARVVRFDRACCNQAACATSRNYLLLEP